MANAAPTGPDDTILYGTYPFINLGQACTNGVDVDLRFKLDGGAAASDVRVDDGEGSMTVGKSPKSTATVESSNGRITVRVGG